MDDLPQRVEIGISRLKLVLLTLAAILMTGSSALLAFRIIPDIFAGDYAEFVGCAGLIFFGLCLVAIVWRLFTARGVVLTLDGEGIRDRRISDRLIPWSVVRDISLWQSHRQRFMIVSVDPEFERELKPSRFASMMREANRSLGADGLAISSNDLKIGLDALFKTARAYWEKSVG